MPLAACASETEVTVTQWFVAGVQNTGSKDRGPLRVYGIPHGASKQRQRSLWRSGSIVRRVSSTLLETRFGTRIKLHGQIDAEAALRMSMKQDVIDEFASGFPARWRSIAQHAFTIDPRSSRNTHVESVLKKDHIQESLMNAPRKLANQAATRARSTSRIQMVTVPLSNFKPNAKKRRFDEPPSFVSQTLASPVRHETTKNLTAKKSKPILKPEQANESHPVEKMHNNKESKKTEAEKVQTKVIDLTTPPIIPVDKLALKKSRTTLKNKFSVDSLLARRELAVEKGELSNSQQMKSKRKAQRSFYVFPEPKPVLSSRKAANLRTALDSKKKSEEGNAFKRVAEKSVSKKKMITSNNVPVPSKKARKLSISFKDQLFEIEEVPPIPRRASRRAARMAKASLAATAVDTPETTCATSTRKIRSVLAPISNCKAVSTSGSTTWTIEQVKAYDRMRDTVPGDTDRYWERVAAGVPGRTGEECSDRFWDSAKTPEKRKNVVSKSSKSGGKSTPEVAAKYVEEGVTKAHTKTAKFAQNMRRIVAANAKEVVESGENVFVPPRVEGYSPATPKRFEWDDDPITPGTEARERLKQMEAPEIETPEPYRRGAAAVSVADRIAAQFKKQFGNMTDVGSIGGTEKRVDRRVGQGVVANEEGLNMEDVLRDNRENEDNGFASTINRQSDDDDDESGKSESEEDKII